MSQVIDKGKKPEQRRVKLSDKEPFNWLPKLSYFRNNYFLGAVRLLIMQKVFRDISCSSYSPLFLIAEDLAQ